MEVENWSVVSTFCFQGLILKVIPSCENVWPVKIEVNFITKRKKGNMGIAGGGCGEVLVAPATSRFRGILIQ